MIQHEANHILTTETKGDDYKFLRLTVDMHFKHLRRATTLFQLHSFILSSRAFAVTPLSKYSITTTSQHQLNMSSADAKTSLQDQNDPLYIDETTLFYNTQPTTEILNVVDKESTKIRNALGSNNIKRGPVHVGSSAIKGMPGSPVIDLAIEVSGSFPPSPSLIEELEAIGYDYKGSAPHDKDDHWAMGGADVPKGHIGRAVLHIVPSGSRFIDNARSFVDYCNTHSEAFDAYANIKRKGALLGMEANENGHRMYKMTKGKVVSQLLKEAKEWSSKES